MVVESPFFETKHLKAYIPSKKGPVKTVDDVSLKIHEGECVGILGESGCGKTSFITAALGFFKIMHRLKHVVSDAVIPIAQDIYRPHVWDEMMSGSTFYRGVDILALSEKERVGYLGKHISLIPQGLQGSLTPIFSIGDQTGEPLEIHEAEDIRQKEMRARVLEYLDLVNLADARERYILDPAKFSGGEAQRILIATALIAGPHLVIADEPTSALDVSMQRQIMGLLQMVQEEFNVALLLVSHDAGVIAEMADRVAIMYAGKLVEIGSAKQIFHEPGHPYTTGLMAAFPTIAMMRMRESGKRPQLRGIHGTPPNLAEIPLGCAFNPRCPFVRDICASETPELIEVEEGHMVRCHRYEEIKGDL